MRRVNHLLLIAVVVLAAGIATSALAAPVTVTVAVSGSPVPGATVSAKATVAITDGSVLQSITWKQTGGLAAVLGNTTGDTVSLTLPDRKTFKNQLLEVLEESPLAVSAYP